MTRVYKPLKKNYMAKVARQVKDGYNVAIFSRVDKKDRVTLIPAGEEHHRREVIR